MNLNDGGTTWQHPKLQHSLSDLKSDVDAAAVHRYLTMSYWALGIPLETVERSIAGSHCFSLFDQDKRQVGFTRIVSDHATFAYVGDVYVLEDSRGKGLATWMMACVMDHPDLQRLRSWTLATRDMHALYAKFGFTAVEDPAKLMTFRPKIDYGR